MGLFLAAYANAVCAVHAPEMGTAGQNLCSWTALCTLAAGSAVVLNVISLTAVSHNGKPDGSGSPLGARMLSGQSTWGIENQKTARGEKEAGGEKEAEKFFQLCSSVRVFRWNVGASVHLRTETEPELLKWSHFPFQFLYGFGILLLYPAIAPLFC